MTIETAHKKEEVPLATPTTTPPRVYYLPDSQGHMASYYNAMELPEHYTTNHGIPRTNHFIPVGYCCLDDIAPRSKGYRGSNPRQPHTANGNIPYTQQTPDVRHEEQHTVAEPRAPPPSPELVSVKDVPASAHGPPTLDQHLISLTQDAKPPMGPATSTFLQSHHQRHAETPAGPSTCSAAICMYRSSTSAGTAPVNHTPGLGYNYPAICRRWLTGTCRRGPACRNRHHVLHETDAELQRIREAHLATMRFYNKIVDVRQQVREVSVVAKQTSALDKELLILTDDEKGEEKFVEAHIEGLGRVKIPVEALSGQLKGMNLDDATPSPENPPNKLIPISPATSASDTNLEPLPDYSLAMPPVPNAGAPAATPKPALPAVSLPPHSPHRPQRGVQRGFIQPADRLRASYTPNHPHHPSHSHPLPPRTYPPQDFVPRHVLDRALRQYIAGTVRGRRWLGPQLAPGVGGQGFGGQTARRRAVVAQMQGNKEGGMKGEGGDGSVKVKIEGDGDGRDKGVGQCEVASGVAAQGAVISKEGTAPASVKGKEKEDVRKRSEVVGSECGAGKKEGKGEVRAGKAAVVPALLVDLAQV